MNLSIAINFLSKFEPEKLSTYFKLLALLNPELCSGNFSSSWQPHHSDHCFLFRQCCQMIGFIPSSHRIVVICRKILFQIFEERCWFFWNSFAVCKVQGVWFCFWGYERSCVMTMIIQRPLFELTCRIPGMLIQIDYLEICFHNEECRRIL